MSRYLLAAAALVALIFFAADAWAQAAITGAANGNPADTFPAALGYAALAVITTAGGTMATVIGKLWKAQRDQDALHVNGMHELRKDHRNTIQSVKDECRAQLDKMRDRLELEQTERREEAERLLREQKDIMREVMVTCSAINGTLDKNTEALDHLGKQLAWYGEPEKGK